LGVLEPEQKWHKRRSLLIWCNVSFWRLEATMTELERPERLQIMLSAEELAALENWRFEQRMPSRAAAIRELLRRGLAAEGMLNGQGVKSQSFGVLSEQAEPDGDATA
jgi:hypothetical protein